MAGRKRANRETKSDRLSIWLTPSDKQRLKAKAIAYKLSVQELISRFIRDQLDKPDGDNTR